MSIYEPSCLIYLKITFANFQITFTLHKSMHAGDQNVALVIMAGYV